MQTFRPDGNKYVYKWLLFYFIILYSIALILYFNPLHTYLYTSDAKQVYFSVYVEQYNNSIFLFVNIIIYDIVCNVKYYFVKYKIHVLWYIYIYIYMHVHYIYIYIYIYIYLL